MANVKFNRGTYDQRENNTADALAFLAKGTGGTPTTAGDYGYLYLGTQMVATKYLKELDLTGFSAGAGLLEIGTSSNNPVLTSRSIATAYTSGTDTWTSSTTDVPTAGAIVSYVAEQTTGNNTYHGTGGWDSTNWYSYTAKYYKGGSEVTSGTTGYVALGFDLPIADGTNYSTDNTHLTTPKQVADFVAGLAGGMRYIGGLATNSIPANSKPGDTFIASADIVVGTDPQRTIEEGDMVVLNSNYTSGNLAYADGKWNFDMFERNVDGSVTKTADMTQYGVAYATGTSTITSTAAGAVGSILIGQGSAAPTWLAKSATAGQILKTGSTTVEWVDYYYQTVAAVSGHANQISVTPYTNGNAGTATTITINDVAHATNADKVNQTASTTDADKPLLIGAGGTSGDPQDVNYSAKISANAGSGLITANEIKLGASGSQINVYETLTWQTLS